MVEAILWDNDGVLVNTESLFFEVNRDFFAEYDIRLSEQEFFDWFLKENCGAWHLLKERARPSSLWVILDLFEDGMVRFG